MAFLLKVTYMKYHFCSSNFSMFVYKTIQWHLKLNFNPCFFSATAEESTLYSMM